MRSLLLLVAVTAVALAQPPRPTTSVPPTLLMLAIRHLASPALHEELKLDAQAVEKAKKVAATGGRASAVMIGRADRDEEERLLRRDLAFLTADQLKRLREVEMQRAERDAIPARTLAAEKEVIDRLKLTDDQRAKLDGKTLFRSVLTDDQKKEWKAMIGKPFDGVLTVAARPGSTAARSAPSAVQFLRHPAVLDDLKLTAAQIERIDEVGDRWLTAVPSTRTIVEADRAPARALEETLNAAAEKVLTDGQRKRLAQIRLHLALAATPEHERLVSAPAAKAFRLSDVERKALDAVAQARRLGLVKLFAPDAEVADVKARVKEFHAETAKRLAAALPKGKSADDLFGAPFVGEVTVVAPVRPEGAVVFGKAVLPVLDRGVRFLGTPALHADLGLTAEQARRLTDVASGGPFGSPTEGATEKKLKAFLWPDQVVRIKQVLLQQFAATPALKGFGDGPTSPRGTAEVLDALQLTEDQKKKMRDGEKSLDVLDDGQKATWKAMIGKPYEGGRLAQTPATVKGRMTSTVGAVALLEAAAVGKELGLSDGQRGSLADVARAYRTEAWMRGREDTAEQRQRREAAAAKADAAAVGLLSEAQRKRFTELRLQRAQRRGLSVLLRDPAAAALKVSDDQRKTIEAVTRRADGLASLLADEAGGSGAWWTADMLTLNAAVREARTRIVTAGREKADAALTATQRDELKGLMGKAFEGALP